MNFINSEKPNNIGETTANINNQLEQARREGIRDVVRYLMSYKPTTPWGESVAKHFDIDLNNLNGMPESSLLKMIDEQNKEMVKQFNNPTFEESNSHLFNEVKLKDGKVTYNKLTHKEQEEAYLKATGLTKEQYDSIVSPISKPIHCDARVIHKCGECKYCDKYGASQQISRIVLMVCFTNEVSEKMPLKDWKSYTKDWKPCPAMFARGNSVNSWHGNVAVKENK